MLTVDVRRQNGIHDCVPHNWSAGSPKSARTRAQNVATVVADRAGGTRADRDGTSRFVAASGIRESRASSSVVTVTVTSEKLVVSVGENAEEAGVTGNCCWCDHHLPGSFRISATATVALGVADAQGRHANSAH